LIDFVAFLVQKLRQNNRILIREIPQDFVNYLSVFGRNFGTRNARTGLHNLFAIAGRQ